MLAGMVHHSGKIWDADNAINGHTDTPCTPIHVMHSCHVHVCMCVINNFLVPYIRLSDTLSLQGASVHGCREARASAAGNHTHFGIIWVDCCVLRL